MQFGWKPAALFSDVVGEPYFPAENAVAQLVSEGQLKSRTFIFPELSVLSVAHSVRYTAYFATGNEVAGEVILGALSWRALSADSPTTNSEFIVGRALGYSDADIFAFVMHFAR